ncbi:dihydrofolate reductase family protein [Rhodococcus sp. IEGM 1408]|uniref:dihydrofolate reductase family protein n=1 Tax=Rhodococcus sp. IEGM 1408 TaxID=3082220 RepID=UPI00295538E4|nr:dihydrofolate reductase family protein [Rhodococcus sp. IEGM 1408]MDV8001565.1 dihydrofolate reductase family protein [Rhodococcus sp. IEGM 1408]
MRKLIYYVAVSVDGFIAGPDGRTDSFLSEGDHMAWLIEHYPETIPGHFRGLLGLAETPPREFDTVVMGRATHQIAVDEGLASGYPHLRQYVVTHRPEGLPVVEGLSASDADPLALVRELKAEDSPLDIWLCGGGALAGALVDEIDEFRLKVNPLILGAGIPLVARDAGRAGGVGAASGGAGGGAASGGAGGGGAGPLPLVQRMRREFASGVSYVEYTRA